MAVGGPVVGQVPVEGEPPPLADPAAVLAAINAQPGTAGYCASARSPVTVPGLAAATEVLSLSGNHCEPYYPLVSGRWLSGPGEIVVATPFLTATGTRVGDTVSVTDKGTVVAVRIVGEVFNTENRGTQLLADEGTLAAAEPDLKAERYDITVQSGTNPAGYAKTLDDAVASLGAHADTADGDGADFVVVVNALSALLTVLLLLVAGLGVVNLVLLHTRERVRDLGVVRALGMTPRQSVYMVTASVVVTGVVGGIVGVVVGFWAHARVIQGMGRNTGFHLPTSVVEVLGPTQWLLLGIGGLAVAVLGALPAASWAARMRTATALRTE